MSVWGKIVGGMGGFALGGPLGALVGAMGGHVIDKLTDKPEKSEQISGFTQDGSAQEKDGTKTIAFTIALIALGAKMAKADGQVTRDEIAAFKAIFRIPPEDMEKVGRLFNQAKKDTSGYELYAKQMARLFANNPAVLEELLWCLAYIAKADNKIHQGELEFLQNVAQIFGFSHNDFERITDLTPDGGKAGPYAVLGIAPTASLDEAKLAHRKLVMEYHPDKLVSQGLPKEFVAQANEKLAQINAAFDQIKMAHHRENP